MLKQLDKNINEDKAILDKHISKYLDGVNKTIIFTELILFISSLGACLLVLTDLYPLELTLSTSLIPIKVYIIEQLIHKVVAWIIIGCYFLLCRNKSLEKRTNLLCSLTVTLTSLLAFGCWNVSYLGFLFITPVIISSPFSNKTQRRMFIICAILNVVYTVSMATFKHDPHSYLIGILSLSSVIIYYMISRTLHKTMYNALLDVKEYSSLNKKLNEEVTHDHLTNALSVSALHNDIDKEDNNYKSLAFLDIDNFKSINDKYGHDMGDNILKLLVNVVQISKEHIYRYGGDEFVILSSNTAKELTKKLEVSKTQFTDACINQYNFKVTLSIGVINIVVKEKLFDYLKQCDKLMYISKAEGKNRITTEAD